MTIRELLNEKDGTFYNFEVYTGDRFHTDHITYTDRFDPDAEVIDFQLMDNEEYNSTILANAMPEDFEQVYDCRDAKVLCILTREG